MSYRSVKRVLGETRLELKCLLLFAVCLLTLIGGSFWWYGSRTEDLVYQNSRNNCQRVAKAVLMKQHCKYFMTEAFNESNGGGDHPLLKPQRDLLDVTDYMAGTLFSNEFDSSDPSNQDVLTSKGEPQENEIGWRLLKPDSDKPENAPEKQIDIMALKRFANSTSPISGDATYPGEYFDYHSSERADGKKYYYYYQPIRLGKMCQYCHYGSSRTVTLGAAGGFATPPPPQVGDLMGVMRIIMSDLDTQDVNINRAIFLATAIVTVFLAMLASYAIVRYVIIKPLKHLRDVSEEISRGNMEARAEISTADEFEEVGVAFNKMVRHLVSTQDELKHTNVVLDTKVDELAQTNMRLYEMNRLKSDFLATMSHELRTPLNSIIGFSEVLDSIKSLDDKQRRYVQNIQKSGRMLLDMINDILDLAKIESGKMDIRLVDFRIDAVVQAQCDFFRPQTERKNIDLEIDVEPGLPELFQDQSKVQQILSNLLSNAIKFTPEGGRVAVRVRRATQDSQASGDIPDSDQLHADKFDAEHFRGDALLMMVSDTGVGIAEEDQVAIFEKFRQGQAVMAQGDAITREYSGTGLGLSIVKELCKLLGGEVSVESQIGRGSTFTVRLPWMCPGHAQRDAAMQDNLEEMLRPWRQEVQRTLERPLAAAPGSDR